MIKVKPAGVLRCALLVGIFFFCGSGNSQPLNDVGALIVRANGGDAEAQVELGLRYFQGRGLREDDRAAFEWFRRAAALGSVEGMYQLASLYAFGLGVPPGEPDPDVRAAQFYFEAARRGHAGAQHSLGLFYLTGKGVQQDRAEAAKWFRRAADQGHPGAERFVSPAGASR